MWIPILKKAKDPPDLAVLNLLREPLTNVVPHLCEELDEDIKSDFMAFCDCMRQHFPNESERWLGLIAKYGSERDKRVTAMGRKYQRPPEDGK